MCFHVGRLVIVKGIRRNISLPASWSSSLVSLKECHHSSIAPTLSGQFKGQSLS